MTIDTNPYPERQRDSSVTRSARDAFKSILFQKNHKGKIIILYDDDERIAPQAATVMVERGYNNIFLLSGGKFSCQITIRLVYFIDFS